MKRVDRRRKWNGKKEIQRGSEEGREEEEEGTELNEGSGK